MKQKLKKDLYLLTPLTNSVMRFKYCEKKFQRNLKMTRCEKRTLQKHNRKNPFKSVKTQLEPIEIMPLCCQRKNYLV
jgi:hypothetical protein